jgi:hypothetical protein
MSSMSSATAYTRSFLECHGEHYLYLNPKYAPD